MAIESPTASAPARLERVPPHSEEAERGVLGSVLLDAGKVMDLCVERQLVPESFYVPVHRTLFEVMLDMSREGRPIDLLTLAERLRTASLLDRIGGPATLDHLVDSTPTAAHAEYYIDIVRQKHLLRSVIDNAREAERACYSGDDDADAVLAKVEQSFFDITEHQHGTMRPWNDVVKETFQYIDDVASGKRTTAGIRTGFRNIDNVILGLQPDNIIILAARPSMGKTSLAMNIVENIALGEADTANQPRRIGIFSLEMSCNDLIKRMICSRGEIRSQQLSAGFMSDETHRKLVNAVDLLQRAAIFLDDTAGLDVTELRARARRMKKKHDVALIVIDYLQLLHASEYSRQGRQIEVSMISGALKAMAKELHVPVLVISQLSRAPEGRESGKPKLSDLRDSGSIEQDADVVLMLRRPAMYPDDAEYEDKSLAILDIAKNRNGPTHDDVRLNFDAEFTRFRDRAHGVDENVQPAYMHQEAP